jgi:short-subunit dehydrogenase
MDIKDRTVLLTGASRGIGLELSKHLAREGTKLILVARHFENKDLGDKHIYIEADITDQEGITKIEDVIVNCEIDILINMAGIGIYKPLEKLSFQELNQSLQVNVIAPFVLIKLTLNQLKRSEIGLVLNIGSGAETMPFKHRSAYCASKYALRELSLSLSEEMESSKPEFCLITLGSTMTTFGGKTIEKQKEKVKEGGAIFPVEYVASEIINIIKSKKRESEIILYPSEHGFGEWKKS